jgi:hypothetical protein
VKPTDSAPPHSLYDDDDDDNNNNGNNNDDDDNDDYHYKNSDDDDDDDDVYLNKLQQRTSQNLFSIRTSQKGISTKYINDNKKINDDKA